MAPSYGTSYPITRGTSYAPGRALLGGGAGIPSWVVNQAGTTPDINFNFTLNQSWTKSTSALSTAASLLTVSRASTGYVNDSNGNWTSVASNLPRISNLGLLVEEARTNSIRNNSMQGAMVMADGVELLTNGNFAGGSGATAPNWTVHAGTGTINFTGSSVQITGNGTDFTTYISQQLNGLVVGRSYVVIGATTGAVTTFQYGLGTSAGAQDLAGWSSPICGNGNASTNPDRIAFTATASSMWISFARQTASLVTIASLSVQDGERVENGGFTSSPINASQSTVQNGWQWTGNVAPVYSANTVQVAGDGAVNTALIAAIPTLANCTYTVSFSATNNTGTLQAGTTPGGSTLLSAAFTSGGAQKLQFTASGTTSYISFKLSSTTASIISNVSVQSAGAIPTNWIATNTTGLPLTVQATGTENGIDYVDINLAGTSSSGSLLLFNETTAVMAALYGQTWTASTFVRPSNLTNFSAADFRVQEDGGTTPFTTSNILSLSTSASLGTQRVSASQTLSQPATAHVYCLFRLAPNGAVNNTLRIGWPQLENNATINSTVASAVTAASGASGVNGSAVYSVGGGTGTGATLNCTWAAGVLTVNSVASAGSYTVFPPSPAALTYVSGTASGWTGATVTLTPTNLAANAFATSPIRTTVAAATRAADIVTMTTPPTFGSAYSMYAKGTPQTSTTYSVAQNPLSISDSSNNNRLVARRNATGIPHILVATGGVATVNADIGSAVLWAQNSSGKIALAAAAGDQKLAFNGALDANSYTSAMPVGVNTVYIGASATGDTWMNGFIAEAAIWSSQRVPDAQLQSITT